MHKVRGILQHGVQGFYVEWATGSNGFQVSLDQCTVYLCRSNGVSWLSLESCVYVLLCYFYTFFSAKEKTVAPASLTV